MILNNNQPQISDMKYEVFIADKFIGPDDFSVEEESIEIKKRIKFSLLSENPYVSYNIEQGRNNLMKLILTLSYEDLTTDSIKKLYSFYKNLQSNPIIVWNKSSNPNVKYIGGNKQSLEMNLINNISSILLASSSYTIQFESVYDNNFRYLSGEPYLLKREISI